MTLRRPFLSARLFMLVGLAAPTAALAQTIVWTDNNGLRIQKKDASGGNVETVVQFQPPNGVGQIHYDPVAAKLYYTGGTGFQRSNFDGSDPENIPTPSAGKFTLNVDSRKLYWITFPSFNALHYSELDGSGAASHNYPSGTLKCLEAFGDDVFFGAGGAMAKGVWRADADGANEQFLHGSPEPWDLGYDPVENKLYLAAEAIWGINADGSGFEQVVFLPQWQSFNSYPTQVVVDAWGRKLYWADNDAQVIQRSNLDGSNVEDFVTATDVGNPNFDIRGLTIVSNVSPIPAMSSASLVATAALLLGAGCLVLRKRWHSRGLDELGNSALEENKMMPKAFPFDRRGGGRYELQFCSPWLWDGAHKPKISIPTRWRRPTARCGCGVARTERWPIRAMAGCATSATSAFRGISTPIIPCGRRTSTVCRQRALNRSV